jgi:hypothetical protein
LSVGGLLPDYGLTESQLSQSGVAVEKLPTKFAKIKLRQDALQTTFSTFLDNFYPPNPRCFEGNGVFQHPQALSQLAPLFAKQAKGKRKLVLSRYYANGEGCINAV